MVVNLFSVCFESKREKAGSQAPEDPWGYVLLCRLSVYVICVPCCF